MKINNSLTALQHEPDLNSTALCELLHVQCYFDIKIPIILLLLNYIMGLLNAQI